MIKVERIIVTAIAAVLINFVRSVGLKLWL